MAIDDLARIAAGGTLRDLGESAPSPELEAIEESFTAKWLEEAVVLINAARGLGELRKQDA